MDSAQPHNSNTAVTNEHADIGKSEVKKKWLAIAYAVLVLVFAAGFWLSDANSDQAASASAPVEQVAR